MTGTVATDGLSMNHCTHKDGRACTLHCSTSRWPAKPAHCHRSDTSSLHCLVCTHNRMLYPVRQHTHPRAGPWPVKPQHLQELTAKEQDGPDKPSAADVQAQKQRQQQQAGGRQSAGGGPAVVEQVLQLNNELFMTPEALFR